VLELNQNISNQLPVTHPATTKARGSEKEGHREEKFNIKAKREQMENIKRTIKDKLISLNNKSRSIETLLEDDGKSGVNSALPSYRAQAPLHAALGSSHAPSSEERDVPVGFPQPDSNVRREGTCKLALLLPLSIPDDPPDCRREGDPEFLQERERERCPEHERPSKPAHRVEFCPPHAKESRHLYKPNNITIDVLTTVCNAPIEKEKENAHAKADVNSKSFKPPASRDPSAAGSIPILLKQKSMRV
jgi:hypothetical protein